MDESMVDNRLKYENYKEQFRRLNKALVNGFNLEAMFIEYILLETRRGVALSYAPAEVAV